MTPKFASCLLVACLGLLWLPVLLGQAVQCNQVSGLGSSATLPYTNFMSATNSLAEVAAAGSAGQASSRANLGLSSMATNAASNFYQTNNNFAEFLASGSIAQGTARTNLGLGTAATNAASAFDTNGAAAAVATSDGTLYAPIASPTFTGIVTLPKLSTNGSLPTIATGTGAGTGSPTATMTAGSTDTSGSFTVVTGTALTEATSATIITLTFNVSPGVAPKAVIVSPYNLSASSLFGGSAPFVSATSSTNFTFTSGTTAIGGATTFKYSYLVIW